MTKNIIAKKWKFSIKNKIITGFFCLLIVLVISIFITLGEINQTEKFTNQFVKQNTPLLDSIDDLYINLLSTNSELQQWILFNDTKNIKQQQQHWQNLASISSKIDLKIVQKQDPLLMAKWQEIKSYLLQIQQAEEKLIAIKQKDIKSFQSSETKNFLTATLSPLFEKAQKLFIQYSPTEPTLVSLLESEATQNSGRLNQQIKNVYKLQWVLLTIGIILAIAISWLTAKSIINPIQYAISIANRIAKGDRNIEIAINSRDETANLLSALNEMYNDIVKTENQLKSSEEKVLNLLQSLQNRIRQYRDHISLITRGDLRESLKIIDEDDLAKLGEHLNEMTNSLNQIAKQIIAAANDISVGLNELENTASAQAASATEQATSVTEISSVVEEIKTTSIQTLEKAMKLGESAELTQKEGEKGKHALKAMNLSMKTLQEKMKLIADTILGLSDKTQQIGEITEAVSSLAKQSKMLALNAAIEAAKAGEAGKGFAVVANEVKDFAEQSQQATERVQKILQDIRQTTERAVMSTEEGTKGVKASLEQVHQTDTIISALGEVIQESAIASQQIVAAVRQETAGIDQVVTSIEEIDKVTRQFTTASEQTKQASLNLANVAAMLKQSVSIYKVSE